MHYDSALQGFPEGYTANCWPLEEDLLKNATQRNHGSRKSTDKTKKEHDRRRHALLGNAVTVQAGQTDKYEGRCTSLAEHTA